MKYELEKETLQTQKNWVSTHFCNKGEDDCDFESFVQVEFLPSFNFTVGSLICQQQNLTWGGHLQFLTLGSSDCKHHEPMELIFLRKSANQNAHFPPNFQYQFGIWESEVDIWILKYQGMYQMHFHLWLIDWESNPVLKWDLWLSWAMIHPPRPNSNQIKPGKVNKIFCNFVMELFFTNEPSYRILKEKTRLHKGVHRARSASFRVAVFLLIGREITNLSVPDERKN